MDGRDLPARLVSVNPRLLTPSQKREAFNCDITYATTRAGLYYLRDNMVTDVKDRVLRGCMSQSSMRSDSILVDESRTPPIISGGAKNSNLYLQ